MFRSFVATGLAVVVLAGALPLAHAQFADDTQSLFTGDPDAPKTQDDYITIDLDNDEAEQIYGGASGAQTVEELCCTMTPEERAVDGLCFDVQCPE